MTWENGQWIQTARCTRTRPPCGPKSSHAAGLQWDELAAAVVGDDAIAHVEKQRVELVALVLHGFERGVEHGCHVVECGGQNANLVRRFDSKRFVEVAGRDALGALGQFFNGVDHGLGEQERQKHRDEKTDRAVLAE